MGAKQRAAEVDKMIFETHAHYNDRKYDEDRDKLLEALPGEGIGRVINVSASWQDMLDTLDLASRWPFLYAAVGIHPDHVGELDQDRMGKLREYCHAEKVVAVGEIGLDYHWNVEPKEIQKKWFRAQLSLAREEGLPVVIHSRDAARDTFDIMKQDHDGQDGGIIHCYSGSVEMAREYVKLGYMIGVGGVVTFKNGRVLKEVVKEIPIHHIVVETDCPYLAPVPYRGKRNSSAYLPYIIGQIAVIKEMDPKEVEERTWENAMKVYRMNS